MVIYTFSICFLLGFLGLWKFWFCMYILTFSGVISSQNRWSIADVIILNDWIWKCIIHLVFYIFNISQNSTQKTEKNCYERTVLKSANLFDTLLNLISIQKLCSESSTFFLLFCNVKRYFADNDLSSFSKEDKDVPH